MAGSIMSDQDVQKYLHGWADGYAVGQSEREQAEDLLRSAEMKLKQVRSWLKSQHWSDVDFDTLDKILIGGI
jgi:hypothetical protein